MHIEKKKSSNAILANVIFRTKIGAIKKTNFLSHLSHRKLMSYRPSSSTMNFINSCPRAALFCSSLKKIASGNLKKS